MNEEFVASALTANQLLALLFICENQRKNTGLQSKHFTMTQRGQWPKTWDELITTFAPRLENLDESLRFEVLEAHLMSVEDIDIYNNAILGNLLKQNASWMNHLAADLGREKIFQTKGPTNA